MKYPLSELVDRKTILTLKLKHATKPERFQQEFDDISNAIEKHGFEDKKLLAKLLKINEKIWDLEYDIRKGKEGQFTFEEIGRRALLIRDYNKKRIAIKNQVAKMAGQFREYKV
jgi:hypothetical protein